MTNIEKLMAELAESSVALKKRLYRRDEAASTTPEGKEGPRKPIHVCRVCNKGAVGKDAQVNHQSGCALARLQRAQSALREAWPELFGGKAKSTGAS